MLAKEHEFPDGSTKWTDYFIQSVSEELPDGLYTLTVGNARLRAIRQDGRWLVTGQL